MSEEWLEVEHARVGRLRVASADVIHFDGIPGFPAARRFALVAHDDSPRFAWLACLDDPSLAFPVTALQDAAPELHESLGPAQLSAVEASHPSQVEAFVVVNLTRRPPTAQVDAPLLVHAETRRGAQVLLEVRGDPSEPRR